METNLTKNSVTDKHSQFSIETYSIEGESVKVSYYDSSYPECSFDTKVSLNKLEDFTVKNFDNAHKHLQETSFYFEHPEDYNVKAFVYENINRILHAYLNDAATPTVKKPVSKLTIIQLANNIGNLIMLKRLVDEVTVEKIDSLVADLSKYVKA